MLRAVVIAIFLTGLAGPVLAFELNRAESLKFKVTWGPLTAGKVRMEYMPQPAIASGTVPYVLSVWVKDSAAFLDMDDTWRAEGVHRGGKAFLSTRYEAKLKENNYRADKVMTFDAKAGTVSYLNRLDKNDKGEVIKMTEGMRDVLSAVYVWRVGGIAELGKAGQAQVVGVKRAFTLAKSAARKEKLVVSGRSMTVWRVDIVGIIPGKQKGENWIVRLRDDAQLTPVQIVAQNKFGTFKANIEE